MCARITLADTSKNPVAVHATHFLLTKFEVVLKNIYILFWNKYMLLWLNIQIIFYKFCFTWYVINILRIAKRLLDITLRVCHQVTELYTAQSIVHHMIVCMTSLTTLLCLSWIIYSMVIPLASFIIFLKLEHVSIPTINTRIRRPLGTRLSRCYHLISCVFWLFWWHAVWEDLGLISQRVMINRTIHINRSSVAKCVLKTLFNIVEERFKKLLNLDVCVV